MRILSIRNFVILCALLGMLPILVKIVPLFRQEFILLIIMAASFVALYKKAGSFAYKAVIGKHSIHALIRSIWFDIDSVKISDDYVTYSSKGKVVGMKAFRVTDVPYTWREMSPESLLRSLFSFSKIAGSEDVVLSYLHRKIPVDKRKFIESLGGSYEIKRRYRIALDLAKQKDAVLQRIREELGEPFDLEFIIFTYAISNSATEAKRKLDTITPAITTRLEDIGVEVETLKGDELLKTLNCFSYL